MNRRNFLSALLAAPVVHEIEPVRRVYSFLWDNPLVRPARAEQLKRLYESGVGFVVKGDRIVEAQAFADWDAMLRAWYTPERVRSLTLGHESRMAGLLSQGTATVTSVDRERGEFTFGRR